jgi:2-methylcitrate dehydratase
MRISRPGSSLMSRVKVAEWDEANRRRKEASICEVEIVLKSGARKKARTDYQRGHPNNPMTDAEMEEKFHRLADEPLSR